MTVAATLLLGIVAAVLLLLSLLLLAQVLFALRSRAPEGAAGRRPSIAVLVPAHNEAAGISPTIAAIKAQLRCGDRILVVADNCSDATARVAAAAGAEVVERNAPLLKGKGYALEFGVHELSLSPPEVVAVVDADCIPAADALDVLATVAAGTSRPVQALYLMSAGKAAGPVARIAAFAWLVKNYVRPLGFKRLGLPCQLMGSGMAFPWAVLHRATLATDNIVEDLTLGLDLARSGHAPLFCPTAQVVSGFPASSEMGSQRTRWEHGHIATIFARSLELIGVAVIRRDPKLFALALDLCVPPLALFAILLAAALAGSAALYAANVARQPMMLSLLSCAAFASAVVLAWLRFGRDQLSVLDLACAPFYALSKIPIYARFVRRRQRDWVRAPREKK